MPLLFDALFSSVASSHLIVDVFNSSRPVLLTYLGLSETQIGLTLEIASSLDHLTRKPLIRNSLRLMRGPARASGLGDLQRVLEAGFDAFAAMQGAQEFISIVAVRERDLCRSLFEAASAAGDDPALQAALP